MPGIGKINLKVVILDTDFYSLQAINSYLAWDRRTRVMHLALSIESLRGYLDETHPSEHPDVIVLDTNRQSFTSPDQLKDTIQQLQNLIPDVMVICLAQSLDTDMIDAAADAGARGYLLKQEVRLQIAWAICYSLEHDFLVTPGVMNGVVRYRNPRIHGATILPDQREYPEMTSRVRQAIKLCVVEGMPAHLAADEMSISLHTIRGYIKEGYRILETYDATEYPVEMTPQERAFMRFTALSKD